MKFDKRNGFVLIGFLLMVVLLLMDVWDGGGLIEIGGLLTAGRSNDCTTPCSGGVTRMWMANVSDISTITEDATGVTAITMVATKKFYEFEFYDETGQFTETVTVTNCSVVVEQSLVMVWQCRDMTDRDAVMQIAGNCCGMVVIHLEATDICWIWGHKEKQRARLATAAGDSGNTFDSQNLETVTITARAKQKAVEFVPGEAGAEALAA